MRTRGHSRLPASPPSPSLVQRGDSTSVSTRSLLQAGLSIVSWAVTAASTVSVGRRDSPGSASAPGTRTWGAGVWR